MYTSLPFALLLAAASAQLNVGVPGITSEDDSTYYTQLCNRTFADANATGIISFDPDVGGSNANISWATTAYQPANSTSRNNQTELSLWFNTNGLNYTNNFRLGYDMCYFWVSQLTINTYERGQFDQGQCLETLDQACITDILNLTDATSKQLVGSPPPGPNSNLTTNSLPNVCSAMAKQITDNFPDSCKIFFETNPPLTVYGGAPALGGALTGPQSLISRSQCRAENNTYSLLWSQIGDATQANYYYANYFVTPLLTAFFPIADAARPVTLSYTKSFLNCIRAKNLNFGSQSVPPAPLPVPLDQLNSSASRNQNSTQILPGGNNTAFLAGNSSSNANTSSNSGGGLSGGAIAGIVIGVLLALGIIGGLVAFFMLKKRKSKKGGVAEMDGSNGYGPLEDRKNSVEAPYGSVHEMDGPGQRAELSSGKPIQLAEMQQPGQAVNRYPAELPGNKTY